MRSCTGLAWRDVERLGSFASVTDPGLGPEFEPGRELGLGLGLPGSTFAVGASGHSTYSYLEVQRVFEEMVLRAVVLVGGEAG